MSDTKKLEELNQRRQRVQIEHAKLSTQVDSARKEYAVLSADSEKEFGTAKVSELEAKLSNIREKNADVLKKGEEEIAAAEAAISRFKMEYESAAGV